jgi:hypothetical protein
MAPRQGSRIAWSVNSELKSGLARKFERRKMSVVSFCVRFFCHDRISGEDLSQGLEQVVCTDNRDSHVVDIPLGTGVALIRGR